MVTLICLEGENTAHYVLSFLKTLFIKWPHQHHTEYCWAKSSLKQKAKFAETWALHHLSQPGVKGLILAGFGEGGAAAIMASQRLEIQNVPVDGLVLFDAVYDIGGPWRGPFIPANVAVTIHGRRHPSTLSRVRLGNCGIAAPYVYRELVLRITHRGASGEDYLLNPQGPPAPNDLVWEQPHPLAPPLPTTVTQAEDWNSAARLWRWMQQEIASLANTIRSTPKPRPGRPAGASYRVKPGDSLSIIAGKHWQDIFLWPLIYNENRSTVGADPNVIHPGQELTIPAIQQYTQAELDAARQLGKSW